MKASGAERGDNDVTALVSDPLSTARDSPIGKVRSGRHQILDFAFAGEGSIRRTTVPSGTSSSRSGATHRHLAEDEPNSKQLCYFLIQTSIWTIQNPLFVLRTPTQGIQDEEYRSKVSHERYIFRRCGRRCVPAPFYEVWTIARLALRDYASTLSRVASNLNHVAGPSSQVVADAKAVAHIRFKYRIFRFTTRYLRCNLQDWHCGLSNYLIQRRTSWQRR